MKAEILYSNLVIIGNGGFGREVLELVKDINIYRERTYKELEYSKTVYCFNILGFLNNDPKSWGTTCNGVEVLGDEAWIENYLKMNYSKNLQIAIGIGDPKIKKKIVEKITSIDKVRLHFPNLIHPSVKIRDQVRLGCGNVITEGNILTCNIELHNHIMINLNSTIGHDCIIKDYCVISPGVNLSGNTIMEEGSYMGTGSKTVEGNRIGEWSTVGAGAVVTKDVAPNTIVVGMPAKPLVKN